MSNRQRVQCGICALRCAPGDRVSIDLRLADGGAQHFFVHWHCLRSVLHPDVALLDVDAYQHSLAEPPDQV